MKTVILTLLILLFGIALGETAWFLFRLYLLNRFSKRKKPIPVDHGYPKMGYPGDDT